MKEEDNEILKGLADYIKTFSEKREEERANDKKLEKEREEKRASERANQRANDKKLEKEREEKRAKLEEKRAREQEERWRKEREKREKERKEKDKALNKKISDIGDKFGYFTEGLALPSMKKILKNKFKMETVVAGVETSKKERNSEIDVLAYSNGDINKVFVVEVKSKVNDKSIKQILRILKDFFYFHPEHKGKKLYGILAGVQFGHNVKQRVLDQGLYFAKIHEDIFSLDTSDNFVAKDFG